MLYMAHICFEERGVEALLSYVICLRGPTLQSLEKCFNLLLMLRLSESIDMFAIATRCLHLLASLFSIVIESAIRELTLLPNFQDITGMPSYSSHAPDVYARLTQSCRRDPVCCRTNVQQIYTDDKMFSQNKSANNTFQPSFSAKRTAEASYKFPEGLIIVVFECYVSAHEYRLHSSANDACKDDAATDWPPPLKLTACYLPHVFPEDQQDFYAMEVMRGIDTAWLGRLNQRRSVALSVRQS